MKQIYARILWACIAIWSLSTHAEDSSATHTLAASCAACHGPNGNSLGGTPTLAALNQAYFVQRMQGFKDGSVTSTVMHHHAKGLTTEEITALASYFAQQPRQTLHALPHQSFLGAQ
jgi:cytochrome subunit of sulfide dehydrogenase